MQSKMIAEVAYSVYAKMVDNKNVRGDELPLFQDLGDTIQHAWITAVEATRNPKLSDLDDKPLVDAFDRLHLALGEPDLDTPPLKHSNTIEIALIDYAIEKLADANGVAA